MNIDYTKPLSEEFIREHQNEVNWNSNNYCSDYLKFDEFVDLAIRLFDLKAFL